MAISSSRLAVAEAGPSPWVPATILGVILVIAVMPYMSRPEPTSIASSYRHSSSYVDVHRTTTRSSSSSFFSLSFLWIPVLLVVLFQWLTGSWPELFHLDGQAGGAARSPAAAASGVMPPAYGWHPAQGAASPAGSWPWSGGFGPIWNAYKRRKNDTVRVSNWLRTSFVDLGGHWCLFFLGILLFSMLLGSRTSVAYNTPPPLTYAPPPPSTFRFPAWSLFLPWRSPAKY